MIKPEVIARLVEISAEYHEVQESWHEFVVETLNDRKCLDKQTTPGLWALMKSEPLGRKLQRKMHKLKLEATQLMLENNLAAYQMPENLR